MTSQSARLTDDVLADIQGFITSGYGHLPRAAYLFVQFDDAGQARRWLRRLRRRSRPPARGPWRQTAGESSRRWRRTSPSAPTVSPLSVCHRGCCAPLPLEFQEGIANPDRSRVLGDTEESDPIEWELGGTGKPPIHAVVVVHAASVDGLETACQTQRTLLHDTAGGVVELPGSIQSGYRPDGDHEPFGFHDGIAQPSIAGIGGDGVPTGEFILGYQNHFQIVPPTPVVPAELDPHGILSPLANPYHASTQLRDLGVNGSYVVYRKLQQDVAGFWQFMKSEAVRTKGAEDIGYMIWLASRCVGRWPSGAPLVLEPGADDPRSSHRDDFLYGGDPDGLACPLGAHIRRTNPRDVIKPYDTAQSLSMSEAHRLLRRARVFGPALLDPAVLTDPTNLAGRKSLLEIADDGIARGIHFFCVNASIRSQFEFVQQTWCNNPRFAGLNDNKDPILGDNARPDQTPSRMTIPRQPFPVRTAALPRVVHVKAGAYLFMPSITALRFLAAIEQ